jgi:hypothetical protein
VNTQYISRQTDIHRRFSRFLTETLTRSHAYMHVNCRLLSHVKWLGNRMICPFRCPLSIYHCHVIVSALSVSQTYAGSSQSPTLDPEICKFEHVRSACMVVVTTISVLWCGCIVTNHRLVRCNNWLFFFLMPYFNVRGRLGAPFQAEWYLAPFISYCSDVKPRTVTVNSFIKPSSHAPKYVTVSKSPAYFGTS